MDNLDIAIIGMNGRFPMADTIEKMWQNIKDGKDCITRNPEKTKDNYVAAYGKLDNIEYFDADFFGFSKKEALDSDPQFRFLIESVYSALEDAGYNSEKYNGKIGLYTTCDEHLYVWNYIMNAKGDWYTNYQLSKFNLDGTFANQIAYRLNFEGPCILSKYACASSLASLHLACQSLLNYECDMAVAGGVSIEPEQEGFFTIEGTVSRSGYTKSFDAEADGFVGGSALGLVVIKRLEDAIKDHDNIIAVIKGTSVNNDGRRKVGFPAPSIKGQEEAILDALFVSGIEPEDVGYIETHGTGTVLGDAVEIRALKDVFNDIEEPLYIGSIKPNIGHTNAAAGISNVIKATLILRDKILPPSINCNKLNDELLEDGCKIVLNQNLRNWESNKKRIVGVSAFGMGGANAIAFLEEYKNKEHKEINRDELIIVSGKSEKALKNNCLNLADYLEKNNVNIQDLAYTLQEGRGDFEYKFFTASQDKKSLISELKNVCDKKIKPSKNDVTKKVVFVFSGSGSIVDTIGRECYDTNTTFKEEMDRCFSIVEKTLKIDLKEKYINYEKYKEELKKDTSLGMIITFSIGYSIAKMWMSLGVKPDLITGHSLGEYIGACIAGVFTIEEAVELITKRSKLFEKIPEGQMINVPLSQEEVEEILTEKVEIGAINGEKRTMISGEKEYMDKFVEKLDQKNIKYTYLPVNRAGHCYSVDNISKEYKEILDKVNYNNSNIPIFSTYTASLLKEDGMSNSEYWINQMKSTVKFYPSIKELSKDDNVIFIEIGASKQMTSLISKIIKRNNNSSAISSFKEGNEINSRRGFLLALGKGYSNGLKIDWNGLYESTPYRVSLPTYAFDRKAYWKYSKRINNGFNEAELISQKPSNDIDNFETIENETNKYRNETDKIVSEIFIEVLGLDEVDIYEDIYEIGFDSLSAVLICSKIETTLGKRLPVKEMYDLKNIAEISDFLSKKHKDLIVKEKETKRETKSLDDLFHELEREE